MGANSDPNVVAREIGEGRNRYEPCPRCDATEGMGLAVIKGHLAVQCFFCGFRGPDIPISGRRTPDHDQAALDRWNQIKRTEPRAES
jgi:hypothetical protein